MHRGNKFSHVCVSVLLWLLTFESLGLETSFLPSTNVAGNIFGHVCLSVCLCVCLCVLISLLTRGLCWNVSAQSKAHAVQICTNEIFPNHLPVIVAHDRPRTT